VTETQSAAKQTRWTSLTSAPFDPFDVNDRLSSKTVRCPKCQKDVEASSKVFLFDQGEIDQFILQISLKATVAAMLSRISPILVHVRSK
jgi:hypothetical protein